MKIKRIALFKEKFGLFGGLNILLRLAFVKTTNIPVPGYPHPISLRYRREDPSDKFVFNSIIAEEEYGYYKLPWVPKNIVDAGGNIGLTSVYFANKYPDVTIFTLEPERANYELLLKNTSGYKNIHPIHKAISNVSDEIVFVNDNGYGACGFMTEKREGKVNSGSIETVSIPELMKEYGLQHIDILKIDIEGYEKELFSSNTEWIPLCKAIYIELHDRMKKGTSTSFFAAIAQYDFSLVKQTHETLFFVNNQFII